VGAIAFEMLAGKSLAASGIALYEPELVKALAAQVGSRESALVLAEALSIYPEKRPVSLRVWAERLGRALR
jgi:hypothetical protein